MKRIFYFTLTICLAVTGYAIGWHRSSRALARCNQTNQVLTEDLARAVRRGVVMEANLLICEDNKNAITH